MERDDATIAPPPEEKISSPTVKMNDEVDGGVGEGDGVVGMDEMGGDEVVERIDRSGEGLVNEEGGDIRRAIVSEGQEGEEGFVTEGEAGAVGEGKIKGEEGEGASEGEGVSEGVGVGEGERMDGGKREGETALEVKMSENQDLHEMAEDCDTVDGCSDGGTNKEVTTNDNIEEKMET